MTPPTVPDDQSAESSEAPDKITVCIEIDADGSISVGTQPEDDGADPSGMTDMAQPQDDEIGMQPAQSIDEALKIATDIAAKADVSLLREPTEHFTGSLDCAPCLHLSTKALRSG